MKSAILSVALLLLFSAFTSAQTSSNEEFTCHGENTKLALIGILLGQVDKEYGRETTHDLVGRLQPTFDLILVNGKNAQTGELICSARITVSMEQINTKTVTERIADAYTKNALLSAAGHPVQEENFLNPSGFGEGTAYWDDVRYSIQPTSDGTDHVMTIEKGQGYKDWFKVMVKYGGLEVTDQDAQLAAEREAGREQAEREAQGAQSVTPQVAEPPKPSFDCAKASSANEKLICSDAELSTLDTEVAALYKEAKTKTKDPAIFKKSSVDAWKWREANCLDKACLVEWYTKRKASLSSPAP